MFNVPNKYRQYGGLMPSDDSYGNNGHFQVPLTQRSGAIIMASDGKGWEHVSVHIAVITDGKQTGTRTPTWDEMCIIKDLFWDKEDWVIQYHPPESQYVNRHPHTLHLWRPVDGQFPTPPKVLVG
jgi:hypothetical protein